MTIQAAATDITTMRLAASTPDAVRFVAELSDESSPKVSRLENPRDWLLIFHKRDFQKGQRLSGLKKQGSSVVSEPEFQIRERLGLSWICRKGD